MHGWVGEWTDRQMNRRMDDGQTDGQMESELESVIITCYLVMASEFLLRRDLGDNCIRKELCVTSYIIFCIRLRKFASFKN